MTWILTIKQQGKPVISDVNRLLFSKYGLQTKKIAEGVYVVHVTSDKLLQVMADIKSLNFTVITRRSPEPSQLPFDSEHQSLPG